jgi:predicted DNA-binding transcriptional regulator YafY
MRRADRLFQLVQLVRGRRLSTAQWLAARLEVSPRTVYRDVADLPPLMFSAGQAKALVACLRLAQPCELRHDCRNFRVDRVVDAQVLEERFRDEPGKSAVDGRPRIRR